MAAKVQCPGCFEEIIPADADRGTTLACGICGTPVPVPLVDPPLRTASSDEPRPKLKKLKPAKKRRILKPLLLGCGSLFLMLILCGGFGYLFRVQVLDVVTGRGGPSSDPEIPRHWCRMKGDGFAMYAPQVLAPPQEERIRVGMDHHTGWSYRYADDTRFDHYTISAVYCTLGADALKRMSHAELLESAFVFSRGFREVGGRTLDGHAGKEYVQERIGENYYWVGKVGDRLYAFRFECFSGQMDRAVMTRLRDAWLRSVTINHPADATDAESPPKADAWIPLKKDGFAVEMPKAAAEYQNPLSRRNSRQYSASDERCRYIAGYADAPKGEFDEANFVLEWLGHGAKSPVSADLSIDGKPGKKWTCRDFFGGPAYAVTVRHSERIYTFSCTVSEGMGIHQSADPVHEARADRFFQSIHFDRDSKIPDPLADEPAWVPFVKDAGFALSGPAEGTAAAIKIGYGRDATAGTTYTLEKDSIVYEAFRFESPPGRAHEMYKSDFVAISKDLVGPTACKIGGRDAYEYSGYDALNRLAFVGFIRSGERVVVLRISVKFGLAKIPDSELEARKKKFFDSFRIDPPAK